MKLRERQTLETRQAVVDSARALFAKQGYAATSLDQIAKAGRVTKGAIYHHFKDKVDVFRAVYVELSIELEAQLREIANAYEARAALPAAIELLLEGAGSPEIRTILFRDGPAVLGGECRKIDRLHYLGLIEETLDELRSGGILKPVDTRVLAPLLLAVLIEGSSLLGHTEDLSATKNALRVALDHLLSGLYVR